MAKRKASHANGTGVVKPPASKAGRRKAAVNQRSKTTTKKLTPKGNETTSSFTSFDIVFGTYERLLYGISTSFPPSSPTLPLLRPIFHFPAHLSSLRSLAVSPNRKHLVSCSSSDDQIKLWSLRQRRELGSLTASDSSVTHLQFDQMGQVLLASDEVGIINVFRCKDWILLKRLRGHKGRVNSISIHPKSSRVALSVGQDRCLRMWDLAAGGSARSGKPVSSVKLGREGDQVLWNAVGDKFGVICGNELTLYTTEMKEICKWVSPRGRLHDFKFFQTDTSTPERVLVACEDGKTRVYAIPTNHETESSDSSHHLIAELTGHKNRVKAISTITLGPLSPQPGTYLVSISSDGTALVYSLHTLSKLDSNVDDASSPLQIKSIAQYDSSGCRPTCLVLVGVDESIKVHLAGTGNMEEEDDDDEEFRGIDNDEQSNHSDDEEEDSNHSDDEEFRGVDLDERSHHSDDDEEGDEEEEEFRGISYDFEEQFRGVGDDSDGMDMAYAFGF